MLKPFKQDALRFLHWQPSEVQYAEAHSFPDGTSTMKIDSLHDDKIVPRIRDSSDPTFALDNRPYASLRIIFCQLVTVHPTCLPISEKTYDGIEELWDLPGSALSALDVHVGTFAEHILRRWPGGPKINLADSPGWVFKSPQKAEMTNGTVVLCHDFATRTTNALWFHSASWWSKGPSPRVIDQIRDNSSLWCNALFLPCIMLTDHILAIQTHVTGGLVRDIIFIEGQLNVTKVGRSAAMQQQQNSIQMSKRKAEMLIVRINNLSTTTNFTFMSPKWHREVCEFLLKLEERLPDSPQTSLEGGEELRDLLQHNLLRAQTLFSQTESHRDRLQLQLDVLYTILSQTDNALNARIAVSAGRDSTSMKILALITAAFLPGTFVATLFSMSMFQWQAETSSSGDEVVSSRFWIYWATAVPLTIATLCGWGLWWNLEKRKYESELLEAQGSTKIVEKKDRTDTFGPRNLFRRY